MQKKSMLIVCSDEDYVNSIEYQLAKALSDKVELSFITNRDCLRVFNESPKNIDILLIENGLYQEVVERQNCKKIYILAENEVSQDELEKHGNTTTIYKYSSIRFIIDQLGSSLFASEQQNESDKTKIISVYSPNGGCGKTSIALGVASRLGKKGYKTLFVSTDLLQDYQYILEENEYMPDSIGYQCSLQSQNALEEMLAYAKKKEFVYFPAWKRALPTYGIRTEHLLNHITLLQKKNMFDYIVVEVTSEIQEERLNFLSQSDRVILVTKQDRQSIYRLQKFLDTIVEWKGQSVIVCNFYDASKKDYIVSLNEKVKDNICERIPQMTDVSFFEEISEKRILEKTAMAVL